jgi:hypothetical protein
MHGSTVGGVLNCTGGEFANPSGVALELTNATVLNTVWLGRGFEAHGTVRLTGARLDRDMVVTGSLDPGQRDYALDLERAHVTTTLHLDPAHCDGVVDLTDATVGTLRDHKDRWPVKLRLVGFTYRHLEDRATSARERLEWLTRNVDVRGVTTFSPRPYEQLAAVYRAAGDARAARDVGIEGHREFRRRQLTKRRDWPRRAWGKFLDVTVAHGYRPGQAFLWLLAAWVVSLLAVLMANGNGALRALSGHGAPTPDFQPLVYAADVLVPLVSFNQATYWQPTGLYALWYWGAILAGWALATALAAGVAAALKRS